MIDPDDIDRAIARADRIIAACREADPGLVALAERVLGRQPTPPAPPLAPRSIATDLERVMAECDRLRADLAAMTDERDQAHADLAEAITQRKRVEIERDKWRLSDAAVRADLDIARGSARLWGDLLRRIVLAADGTDPDAAFGPVHGEALTTPP